MIARVAGVTLASLLDAAGDGDSAAPGPASVDPRLRELLDAALAETRASAGASSGSALKGAAGAAAARASSHREAPTDPSYEEGGTKRVEPPQVLEIRSPPRVDGRHPEAARHLNGPFGEGRPPLRHRFDPPPVAPPEADDMSSPAPHRVGLAPSRAPLQPPPAAPLGAAAAGSSAATGAASQPRRKLKPWQKAPVPMDRPL